MEGLDPNIAVVYNQNTQNTLAGQQLAQEFYRQATFELTHDGREFPSDYLEAKLAGMGHPQVQNVNPPSV
ncbi:hypothetical protein [Crocosphaera sp.]|uniref:hypothetical protein n=1 Tax=Crocosphaera sp. TaxID=2729996 RepID=UPI00261E3453|nr:hypothetical protein [Crocosphaera sp.]MDJ0579080.1 hypothetical protein [Crocosphaera sp.]